MAAAFAACAVAVSAAISSPAFTSSHGKDSSRLCSLPRPSGMCRGRECGNQQPRIHAIGSALHVLHALHEPHALHVMHALHHHAVAA